MLNERLKPRRTGNFCRVRPAISAAPLRQDLPRHGRKRHLKRKTRAGGRAF
jgi:hypothetical protein